jgi:hypothetical protein
MFQDPILCAASVTPTTEVCTAAIFVEKVKVKVKLSVGLTKQNAIKTYGGVKLEA